MCLGPELLIPMALAGAGTAFDYFGDKKAARATTRAIEEQNRKNKALQSKNIATTMAATQNYGNVEQDMEAAQAERDDRLKDVQIPGMNDSYTGSAPDIVNKYNAGRVVDTIEKGKARSKALNKMASLGDVFFDNRLGMQDANTAVGLNNNFVQGNDRVTPFKVNAAKYAGSGLGTVADLFKLGGMASNLYFATGGGLPGGKSLITGDTIVNSGNPFVTPDSIASKWGTLS